MATMSAQQRDIRFSRSEVRTATGLSDTQTRLHLERLCAMEYLLTHRGQRGQSFEYELLHDQAPELDAKHLPGLIDTAALQNLSASASASMPQSTATNPSSWGEQGQFVASSSAHRGANGVGSQTAKSARIPHESSLPADLPIQTLKPRATPVRDLQASYTHASAQQPALAA